MIQKIKDALGYIFGLVVLVLSAIIYRQSKKVEQFEGELANEKSNTAIKVNEAERQITRDNANALVEQYEKLKRDS